MSVRALLSASHESALHHAVKSMPSSIARSRPVRAGERADELTGCGAQESVIGERDTQSLWAVGLESAPEGCGEASGAIVVDRAVTSKFMGCSTAMSPATTATVSAMSAHMMGAGLDDTLGTMRGVQWAAG